MRNGNLPICAERTCPYAHCACTKKVIALRTALIIRYKKKLSSSQCLTRSGSFAHIVNNNIERYSTPAKYLEFVLGKIFVFYCEMGGFFTAQWAAKSHIVARCCEMGGFLLWNGLRNAKYLNNLRGAWDGTECDRINFICKQTLKITSSAGLMLIKLSKLTYLTKVTLRNDTLYTRQLPLKICAVIAHFSSTQRAKQKKMAQFIPFKDILSC